VDIASTGTNKPENSPKIRRQYQVYFGKRGKIWIVGLREGFLRDIDPVYLSHSLTIGLHPIIRRELMYLPLSRVSDL
jgi:hypothetical protein